MKIWDAIVVGAGPAGCACAYDLASANKSVLLLDKSDFPRMKACAGALTTKTLRALRYSIDPVIRQTIHHLVLEERNSASIPVQNRKPICVMTVRAELDAYFLAKTIQAGSAFQRIRGVGRIIQGERSVTVATQDAEFHAHFLVGADGVNSQVRCMTGDAPWFRKGLALEANIYRDARNDDLVFDFAPVASGYGWIFPKRDHVNIGLYCIDPSKHLNRARLSDYIVHRFGDHAKPDNFVGQYLGFGAAQNRAENHRTFLVGDAGGFVDPLTGEGIYGAVISGQAAASAICANLDRDTDASETFIHLTKNLRRNLGISERAAASFYVYPDRGFQAMKIPLLRSAILKSYAEGFNLTSLAHVARRILLGD